MLNGIDPIIIFGFKKLPPSVAANPAVPTAGSGGLPFDLPFIPIYLSEKLTGILIDSEDKNLDVDTTVMATTDGLGFPEAHFEGIQYHLPSRRDHSLSGAAAFLLDQPELRQRSI